MEKVSVKAAAEKIQAYLQRGAKLPYFVFAQDGKEFLELKNKLAGLEQIRASNFCGENSFLDVDALTAVLEDLKNDAVCVGLSEAAFLSGDERILRNLYDRYFSQRIIVLCRSAGDLLRNFAAVVSRFKNFLCFVESKDSFSVVRYAVNLEIETDARNFKELLKILESGRDGTVTVKTNLPLRNVRAIESYHAAIKFEQPNFNLPEKVLTAAQWKKIFHGHSLRYWCSFFEGHQKIFPNAYLKHVFERAATYNDYVGRIFFALLEIDAADKNFVEYYQARKELAKNYAAQDLERYIAGALSKKLAAVCYLTDNTVEECKAAIQAIQGAAKIPAALLKNFSNLAKYLREYDFGDKRLTKYFQRYKELKLTGFDDKNFRLEVENLAGERIYNSLETRQCVLDKLYEDSKLYWLDALGVEYLSYIHSFAQEFGLKAKIQIARAELPTTTQFNKNFYENWRGKRFLKNPRLDDLIHSQSSVDIIDELEILYETLTEILQALRRRETNKVILTSDHGASRLAVIYKGKTLSAKNPGEHGGRYCVAEKIGKPFVAAEENNCWALANYDRFKGGKNSGAEMHGGATLEEIIVPVVEFSL